MAAFISETPFTSGTTAVTTQTVAGPAAPANLAVLRIQRSGGSGTGAITGVTDTAGNTWQRATRGGLNGVSNTRYECWYAQNYVPAATITIAGPAQQTAGSVLGFSGMATTAVLDVASPDYSGVATQTASITTPTITTTVAGDLVIAGAGHSRTTTPGTVGSPWTQTAAAPALNGTAGTSEVAYQLGVPVGSYAATFTEAAAMLAGTFTVAFKAASGSAQSGTVALAGTGTLTLAGTPGVSGSLALSAVGRLTAGPPPQTAADTLALSGSGQLTVSGVGTWPHLAITATPDPTFSPPRIRLDIADTRTTPATSLTITRTNPDGRSYPVRTSDGGPLTLSGGVATLYDYEAPYDAAISYSTDQAGGPSIVTELDVDDVWLIHIGVPSRSCRITVTSLPQRTRATSSTLHKVLGSGFPVPISSGARQAASGPMGVRTITDDDRVNLDLILDDDAVLLLNIPPAKGWGWDACYVNCGDLIEGRTVNWGPFPYREWQLPIQVVGRPGGGTQAAITWNAVNDQYPTWQAIKDAGITSWAQLAAPTT